MSTYGENVTMFPDEEQPRWRVSRRGFLIGMAASGAALALGIPLGLPILRRMAAEFSEGDAGAFFSGELDPLVWIEVHPDERVRLYVPKAEMGQGIHSALGQIAAEELELRWEQLEVVHASTALGGDAMRNTAGSSSVSSMYTPLRQAAAAMREMLRAEAARQLEQPAVELVASEGEFYLEGDPQVRVSYGALVSGEVQWQIPEEDVPLKPVAAFKLIGTSPLRVDLPEKVTGQAVYGYDHRVEGMLYGAVARPPTIEARMATASPGAAADMPGVVRVVIRDGFAGVVAHSRLEAAAARDALEVEWDEGHLWQQDELEELVTAGGRGGVNVQREGNVSSALDSGDTISAEYRSGFAAHASLEPQAALVDVTAQGARIWTSTQAEASVREEVAEALGVDQELVEIVPDYLGGGFGRKIAMDAVPTAATEAALLSQAAGAPVHVGWNRAEEMRHGFLRPISHSALSAALDASGRILALEHLQASGYSLAGVFPRIASLILGFDIGTVRGVRIPYDVPNRSATVWLHRLPIPTGSWRGLGLAPNIFASESFVDELAHAAGADSLQFRLDHLPADEWGSRARLVLEGVAELSGWSTPPPQGRARGVAFCTDVDTIVAEVAEVSLERSTGQIRVHRVWAAVDCGRAISPDGAKAQVEGSIVMGASAALGEEISVQDGRVRTANFDRYPLLRMLDAPQIDTLLLEAPDGRPRGLGEPAVGPIAAAIANALFALTGVRLRRVPMTPERVLGAMEG
jgi:isoquinoline 1-oxidoreductase beta subunit